MLKLNLRNNLLFLISALWVFGCSHLDIHSKKEGTVSALLLDCHRNYTKEGGLISSPIYKTWVKYDHLEFKKGFDLAIKTLQSQGHWILSTDPGSGTISTQIFVKKEQKEGYPATVKIVEEGSALVIHISLKATWGTLDSPNLCSFYDEFGKNTKQVSIRSQKEQPALSSQRLPEGMKESSPASPSPTPIPPLSLSPPPAETLKISPLSLPRGKVIWVYVNLREGPGTQYKIVGKAFMKNTFEIIAEHPDWLRVRLENGTEGWMSKKASSEISVTTSSQTPPASPHDSSKTKFSSKPPCPM